MSLEPRRVVRSLAVAIASLVLCTAGLLLLPSPVAASGVDDAWHCTGTCTFRDAKKDAPAKIDVTRVKVSNTETAFVVDFSVRNLPKAASFTVSAGLSGWGVNYNVTKTKTSVAVDSVTISEVSVYPAEPCPTATVEWNRKKDKVQAVLPFDCTGSTAGGGSIINGIDFISGKRKDSAGHCFYKP